MGLNSISDATYISRWSDISLFIDWSFGCNIFAGRYPFCAKEESVYKIYPKEVMFSFNNVFYNNVVSLVSMALKENGHQYLGKDRSKCLTIDSYSCPNKNLLIVEKRFHFWYFFKVLENRNKVITNKQMHGKIKIVSARLPF